MWDQLLWCGVWTTLIGVGIAVHAKLRAWHELNKRILIRQVERMKDVKRSPEKPGDLSLAVQRTFGLPAGFSISKTVIRDDFNGLPTVVVEHVLRNGELEAVVKALAEVQGLRPPVPVPAPCVADQDDAS